MPGLDVNLAAVVSKGLCSGYQKADARPPVADLQLVQAAATMITTKLI